jgi:hypothetical protein
MDRYDDTKRVRSDDDETPPRQGDVLGLGGADVPKTPGDPSTEYDAESVARRRARARAEGEPETTATDRPQSPGATGIDMGGGGTGTDIE